MTHTPPPAVKFILVKTTVLLQGEKLKTTPPLSPFIISPASIDGIIYMLKSKGLMTRLSFSVCSLTTVTKPLVQVDFQCKCQLEGQRSSELEHRLAKL